MTALPPNAKQLPTANQPKSRTNFDGARPRQLRLESSIDERDELAATVSCSASRLDLCSKEIGQNGDQNRCCKLRIFLRFHPVYEVSVAELFEIMQHPASNAVYPTLQRPDEKHVTEAAYDSPKFRRGHRSRHGYCTERRFSDRLAPLQF